MTRLFRATPHHQTEAARQERVIRYLQVRDWVIKVTEGTMFSYGWPDLYAAHFDHGPRWIEMKVPGGKLRETQTEFIADFARVNIGVWVLTDANPEQYRLLFQPPNWEEFL